MSEFSRRQFLASATAVMAAPMLNTAAWAEAWPSRPVRVIIGYAPGGIVDFTGRTIAQALGQLIDQPIVVENRPGGGGIVGTDAVAKSKPDGYTLLVSDPAITVNPSIQSKMPYELLTDIRAVAMVSTAPLVGIVPASLPVNSLDELAEYGRKNGNTLSYISPGAGTMTHKSGEVFGKLAGLDAVAVNYRGGAAALPDLLTGRVQYVFIGIPSVLPLIQAGKVRALVTTGKERASSLPNVPTAIESGYKDFVFELWHGVFAPSATPDNVVEAIAAKLEETMKQPGTDKLLDRAGAVANFMGPKDAQAFFKAETLRWLPPAGG